MFHHLPQKHMPPKHTVLKQVRFTDETTNIILILRMQEQLVCGAH